MFKEGGGGGWGTRALLFRAPNIFCLPFQYRSAYGYMQAPKIPDNIFWQASNKFFFFFFFFFKGRPNYTHYTDTRGYVSFGWKYQFRNMILKNTNTFDYSIEHDDEITNNRLTVFP